MSDMRLKVVLTGDGRQLTGSLKTAQSEVQQFGQTSVQAGAASTQAFSKTRSGVESISTQLQAARQQLLTFGDKPLVTAWATTHNLCSP